MNIPAISIGLPFFNAEDTLVSAVQSILGQTFTDWELLLLDDGSSDSSLKIARSFNDERIRVYSDGNNLGISARLNQAASLARAKYFFRMDADDLAFPQRLAVQYAFLEQHPDIDLVASNAIFFKSDGEILGTLEVVTEHSDIVANPCAGFYMPHPTWAGHTRWFTENGYDSAFNGAEDHELMYRTIHKSRFACIEEPLLGYREVNSGLGKRFGRRKTLVRAMFKSAHRHGRWGDMACTAFYFVAKASVDFLSHVLGMSGMRTKFLPLPSSMAKHAKWLSEHCSPILQEPQ